MSSSDIFGNVVLTVVHLFLTMQFLNSPYEPWQWGKGWGHATDLFGQVKPRSHLQKWKFKWPWLRLWVCPV